MNRLQDLKRAIEQQQKQHKNRHKPKAQKSDTSFALRAGSDFLGALITGGLLGYAADSYWLTRPWLMVAGLFIGMLAGVQLLLKAAKDEKTP